MEIKTYLIVLFLNLPFIIFAQNQYVDIVFLKNGDSVEGQVLEFVPSYGLKLEIQNGKQYVIKTEEVMKISKRKIGEIANPIIPPTNPTPATKEVSKESIETALVLDFIEKGIATGMPSGSGLYYMVRFTNTTEKDINGLQGTISVNDSDGRWLHDFNVGFDAQVQIKSRQSMAIKVVDPVSPNSRPEFIAIDRTKIRHQWKPRQISFTDGTSLTK